MQGCWAAMICGLSLMHLMTCTIAHQDLQHPKQVTSRKLQQVCPSEQTVALKEDMCDSLSQRHHKMMAIAVFTLLCLSSFAI